VTWRTPAARAYEGPMRESMPHKSLFLQRVRNKAAARRLSQRTVRLYVGWMRRFIRHHGLRHPKGGEAASRGVAVGGEGFVGGASGDK